MGSEPCQQTYLVRPTSDKHSSLLQTFVNYGCEKFYNIGAHWTSRRTTYHGQAYPAYFTGVSVTKEKGFYDVVTKRCWYRAAKCKAVSPLSVLAPSKAPESNKILTVDRWPFMAAQCRAVWWKRFNEPFFYSSLTLWVLWVRWFSIDGHIVDCHLCRALLSCHLGRVLINVDTNVDCRLRRIEV